MHALSAVLIAAAWLGLATAATGQGGGGQSITVDASTLLEVVQPRFGETNPVRLRVELHLAISGDKVSGSISRSVMSKGDINRVVQADHTPFLADWAGQAKRKACLVTLSRSCQATPSLCCKL
jgi:hypothetical protein